MTTGLLTPTHLLILLAIMLLLFGAKRLPETARALGRSIREFKDVLTQPGEISTNTTGKSHSRRARASRDGNSPRNTDA